MTRDEEALLSALGYVGAGTLASAVEAAVAPPREPDSPIAPPPPLIGAVWTALFVCFGVARARLRGLPRERRLVDALWLMCVTYPLYTDGIRSRAAAYAGNAVIAGTAGAIVARARRKGRSDAAAFVLPVLPWVAVATLTLLTERRRR
jgi:tryptophan-rich sensory protein